MIVKDSQNLLTSLIPESLKIPGMILEILPLGIPIHPNSIEKILAKGKSKDRVIALKPTLPISTELGLPSYPILAYLYPQGDILEKLPITLISDLNDNEKKHYFVDCYAAAFKPSYIRVIVGNTCNLKCVMCPYHSSLLKSKHTTNFFKANRVMHWEMMEKLARECGEAKIPILIGSVEEPLLHSMLIEFIKQCRQKGVPAVHLTTNGQLLDKSCAVQLLKSGLTSIDISLDAATQETYFKIRGADLTKVESNIIGFLEIRDQLQVPCEVRVTFVRNPGVSFEEEQNFLNSWSRKVDKVVILNVATYEENNMRTKKTNEIVNQSLSDYQQTVRGRWACLFPFMEMAILPDGRTYYCIETLFRLGFDNDVESLGNFNKQTLGEIWNGDLFKQLRQDLIFNQLETRSICSNCDTWKSQVVNHTINQQYHKSSTTITEIYSQV